MKQKRRARRYSTARIVEITLHGVPYRGRPASWVALLACGHHEKLRLKFKKPLSRDEWREIMNWRFREDGVIPGSLLVPRVGAEAACRDCPPPSLLEKLAGV